MKFTIDTSNKALVLLEKISFKDITKLKKFIGDDWAEWTIEAENETTRNYWWWSYPYYYATPAMGGGNTTGIAFGVGNSGNAGTSITPQNKGYSTANSTNFNLSNGNEKVTICNIEDIGSCTLNAVLDSVSQN